ncbi:flagellar export chaperone FlgN [Nocardioides perillae]|uniref:FlgN protein n=1 Tax=Nocardioides perillae TaxID=1119534 RepID=A0A7Y9RXC4_9ACTN|nr:flagellar export chaperone FlgN [Nocardioides perillae]NYG57019.1 hypothetical protein [Nocardioides perillae]
MEKLSLVLWRERELLDTLHYRLEQEQLLLASGRTRWLIRAAREVEAVLETIRETEVLRAVAADQAAASVGLPAGSSLRDLADAADEPFRSLLHDHREAFQAATLEITALADANRDLITTGYRSARETLMTLGGPVDGYSQDGTATSVAPRHRLVDRSL